MPLKKQDRLSGLQENPQDEMLADDSDIFKNINPNLTLEIGLVGDTNYTTLRLSGIFLLCTLIEGKEQKMLILNDIY
jgi:hypothetical protein